MPKIKQNFDWFLKDYYIRPLQKRHGISWNDIKCSIIEFPLWYSLLFREKSENEIKMYHQNLKIKTTYNDPHCLVKKILKFPSFFNSFLELRYFKNQPIIKVLEYSISSMTQQLSPNFKNINQNFLLRILKLLKLQSQNSS